MKLNIINHTHWDREWYQTFDIFRGKLVEAINIIIERLDSGQFEYFMLDGQTVILEDLQEVMEIEEFNKLENYIKMGKIEIGPWYVLPDEFLVSGESIIRNLQIGINISKKYGQENFIGYLPDTFGHIGQLPQIFKNLGIKWSLLARGVHNKHKSEALFIGSDGTQIKTLILPLFSGYYNHFMCYDNYIEKMQEYLTDVQKFATSDNLLFLNGADHLVTHKFLKKRIKECTQITGVEMSQQKLTDYVKQLDNLNLEDSIYGEQREQIKSYILTNTLSARTYLKVQNQTLEDRLTHLTEPLELIKNLNHKGYKNKFISYIWKSLLKNHPHDSICGCNTDEIHKEMEVRNTKINDMCESIEHYAIKSIIEYKEIDNNKIYLFNPHPYNYTAWVETIIRLSTDIQSFKLTDKNGNNIPIYIASKQKKSVFMSDIELEPTWKQMNEFKVYFLAEFEGLGFECYDIDIEDKFYNSVPIEPVMENEYLKVTITNKDFLKIIDKENGNIYSEAVQFISSLDNGDTYSYSAPINDNFSQSHLIGIENVANTDVGDIINLNYIMTLPQSLNDKRDGKSECNVENNIKLNIVLPKGSKTIRFRATIENKAKDQRLRIVFPIGKSQKNFITDTSFDIKDREGMSQLCFYTKPAEEMKVNTYPTDSFVQIPNEFSIIHKGMHECEITNYDKYTDAVYMTVMRSVGWLSRDDFDTRGGGAGPNFATPDAQMIGKYIFEFGFTVSEDVAFEAKKLRISPKVILGNNIATGFNNILNLDNKKVLVSAFYKNNNCVILRLYNTTHKSQTVKISTDILKSNSTVDLLGNKLEKIKDILILKPLQISTIVFDIIK